MKKISFILLLTFVSFTIALAKDDVNSLRATTVQKSNFKSVAIVERNDFLVPTVVDIPLTFDKNAKKLVLVASSDDEIVPAVVLTDVKKADLNFTATDSFGSKDANNMTDGNPTTFTQFPFQEKSTQYEIVNSDVSVQESVNGGTKVMNSQEKFVGESGSAEDEGFQNEVTIDVHSNREFQADSLRFNFGKNVEMPVRIRLTTLNADGTEQVLIPEQFFTSAILNFPKTKTNHYRIMLKYVKPLRISEIMFFEQNAPQTVNNHVRFVAEPGYEYKIYYNTLSNVNLGNIELPDLTNVSAKRLTAKSKDNPLYKKADTDDDGILDASDNCPTIANEDQLDKDTNGIGDACEDFDHDGVLNAKDNCPTVPNKLQKDEDFDSVGDKCDTQESRFMEKYPWIPYVVLLIVFAVVSILVIKTVI